MNERKTALKEMRICRFCLTEDEPLSNIYDKNVKITDNQIPLPLQIMACVSIEVFASDGMPQYICNICRVQTDKSYKFKANCKKSDDALKLYIATGTLNKPSKTISEILKCEKEDKKENISNLSNAQVICLSESQITNEEGEMILPHDSSDVKNIRIINVQQTNDNIIIEEVDHEETEETEDYLDNSGDEEGNVKEDQMRSEKVKTNVFPCEFCERTFPLKQLLDIHVKNHTRERKFSCKQCDNKFFSKYDLGKHELTHSNEKPYLCVVCKKAFARPTLLHRHEKIHIEVPKYLCIHCDKTFLVKSELDKHETIHKKNRPFPCKICNKSFAFKQGLDRHIEVHKQDKAHKCNYCEQSFDTPAKLARHITTHAGMRPYPCKWCSRTFLLSHHLTRHLRSHYGPNKGGGNANYKCSECTMQFKRKDGLIGHSTIHCMVSMKCIFCSKHFDDLKNVKYHVKTHMEGKVYPCDKCDLLFLTQHHLDDHETQHGLSDIEMEEIEVPLPDEATESSNQEPAGLYEDDKNDENEQQTKQSQSKNKPTNIRRSQRAQKIKDYAQFIKEELGLESDEDSNTVADEDEEEDSAFYGQAPSPKRMKKSSEDETIKPIIKPDGTKTYGSKSSSKKSAAVQPKIVQVEPTTSANSESTQSIDLPPVKIDIPNKLQKKGEIVEMKIGEKIVKVQKVLMTKAEVEEMARQGKIKMKGGAMVLKQTSKKQEDPTKLPLPIMEPEFKSKTQKDSKSTDKKVPKDEPKNVEGEQPKSVRTYFKKATSKVKESEETDVKVIAAKEESVSSEQETKQEVVTDETSQ